MSFKESDKVVCIDDNFTSAVLDPRYRFTGSLPVKDQTYVVEKVMTDDEGCLGFRLTSTTAFITTTARGESEVGYRGIRFRKLEEVKQSAPRVEAIGTKVLVPVHAPVKA